jgi:hypothetical protein
MSKLNAVVAITKGIKSRVYATLTDLNKVIMRAELFNGHYRQYRPKDDDEREALPPEKKHVQFTMPNILRAVRTSQSELYDVVAQLDLANTVAKASVIVDGREILPELPTTTLLFLEKQLTDLRTFVENIPELDTSESWTLDPNSGLFVTQPVETHRTRKTQKVVVLYPATDKHPAQTQLVPEDQIAGFWQTVRQSGAMPKPVKEGIAARVEKLLIAVKEARERANDTDASTKPSIGAPIFDFLLNE